MSVKREKMGERDQAREGEWERKREGEKERYETVKYELNERERKKSSL